MASMQESIIQTIESDLNQTLTSELASKLRRKELNLLLKRVESTKKMFEIQTQSDEISSLIQKLGMIKLAIEKGLKEL